MGDFLLSFLLFFGIGAFIIFFVFVILEIIDFNSSNSFYKNNLRQCEFREKSLNLIYCALMIRIYRREYIDVSEFFDSWYDYYLLPISETGDKQCNDIREIWREPSEYDKLLNYVKENGNKEDFLKWASQWDIRLSLFSDFI